jgi:NADH-quinone oxidoreductase subunit H
MLTQIITILYYILPFILMIVPVLLAVAYFTLFERQVLAALQRRQGPNVVGFYGLLQPLADGLKLFLKESILPKSSNTVIFIFAPIFTLGLALSGWIVIPVGESQMLADFHLGLLFIFALSSLGVHTVIMAGWSSNSKYAFLGGLRSAAQMISYEVSLGVVLVTLLLITGSLNLSNVVESQQNLWLSLPLLPMFILFFICSLAETNRHPFDLPEAEAELVSGYNVEYSAMGFALFFLGESSNIILMSTLSAILFLGGWTPIVDVFPFTLVPGPIYVALKTMFFIFLFVLVRGILPRLRYDQLMRLGWKVFLPIGLAFVCINAALLVSFNGFVELVR